MSLASCTHEHLVRPSGTRHLPRSARVLAVGLLGLLSCAGGEGAGVGAEGDAAAADVPIVRELSMKVNGVPWIATRIATFEVTSSRFGNSILVTGARDGAPEEVYISVGYSPAVGSGTVGPPAGPPTGTITLVRPGEKYSSAPGERIKNPDGTITSPRAGKFLVSVTTFSTAFKDIAIEATFSGEVAAQLATEPSLVITDGKISYSNRTGKPDPKN